MTEQILTLILSIAGGIIVLLLGALGYGIKEFVNSAKGMSSSVNELRAWLTGQDKDVSFLKSNCAVISKETSDKLSHHDERLDGHDDKLGEHEVDIAVLKTKLR